MNTKNVSRSKSGQAFRRPFYRRPILLVVLLSVVVLVAVAYPSAANPAASVAEERTLVSESANLAANPELSAHRRYTANLTNKITCTESALRAPNPDGLDPAAGDVEGRSTLRVITAEDAQRCRLGNLLME